VLRRAHTPRVVEAYHRTPYLGWRVPTRVAARAHHDRRRGALPPLTVHSVHMAGALRRRFRSGRRPGILIVPVQTYPAWQAKATGTCSSGPI